MENSASCSCSPMIVRVYDGDRVIRPTASRGSKRARKRNSGRYVLSILIRSMSIRRVASCRKKIEYVVHVPFSFPSPSRPPFPRVSVSLTRTRDARGNCADCGQHSTDADRQTDSRTKNDLHFRDSNYPNLLSKLFRVA